MVMGDLTDLQVAARRGLTATEDVLRAALIACYKPNHVLNMLNADCDPERAHAEAGEDFGFVFWDGPPAFLRCASDLERVLPYLEDEAYLLIHHAAHYEVAEAIDLALSAHRELIDCGMVGRTARWDTHHQTHYGGLRLLRYTRRRQLTIWAE